MDDIINNFNNEILEFKQWAARVDKKLHADWELNYSYWNRLYTVSSQLIKNLPPVLWEELAPSLLYILARDNESETLLEQFIECPELLIFLAHKGINYADYQARRQLAYGLSRLGFVNRESTTLLLSYLRDENEYVRRRALLGLGFVDVDLVEKNAFAIWESNFEYQKIALLAVLFDAKSHLLDVFMHKAKNDISKDVKMAAKRIEHALMSKEAISATELFLKSSNS